MISPENQSKIAVWRAKANEGTLTLEDVREYVEILRQGRRGAAEASDQARRKRAKATIKDADTLLDELGGL